MKTKTEHLLTVMHIIAWAVFIGLMVKAVALLISYGLSIGNPEAAKNLYRGLDWYPLRQYDLWHYTGMVSLMSAITILEAYIALLVIRTLSRIKLTNPFTAEIAKKLEQTSYLILLTWAATLVYNMQARWLAKRIGDLQEQMMSVEFIFLAGVVFIFAQIFKRGVEIQSENELTV